MESKIIDHLGLVAGMFDELKIEKIIDKHILQDTNFRNVSVGQCVKAMILNGLGFVNYQLYMVSSFLEKKPVEKLFNQDVKASHFNDDVLGRALDDLYSNDICLLFSKISASACKVLGIKEHTYHLDSTSFHTHGEHLNQNPFDENVIELRKGYSRDHHPELNQAILEMIVSNKSGIPLAMKPLSGNKNDNKEFPKIINSFVKNLNNTEIETTTFVADAALFSEENIANLPEGLKFITRIPETLKEVKRHYEELNVADMQAMNDVNYSYVEVFSEYGGVKQRWIILLSKAAQARKLKTYDKNLPKKIQMEEKKLSDLTKKEYACKEDALKDIEKLIPKLKYLVVNKTDIQSLPKHEKKGRPAKNTVPTYFYKITADYSTNEEFILKEKSKLGLFTIATNHLDKYSADELLKLYKDQGKVERGFRFLKDNTFIASSLYLKKPQRIESLMFVMSLCLMVYSALEYRIRKELKDRDLTFTNQVKKEVQNPTTRWVFYNFIGIHILYIDGTFKILNKESKHRKILRILGENYKAYYS